MDRHLIVKTAKYLIFKINPLNGQPKISLQCAAFCHSDDFFDDAKRSLISDIKSYNFYGELLELSQIHCQSKLIAMHCNKKVKQRQTNKLEKERERPWVLGDRPMYLSFDMPAKKKQLRP